MSKPQLVEAVMFFAEDGSIGKQMFYTEFETLLDGLVKMPVFADQQVRVTYLLINTRLQIRSVVFFYLDFDESGAPDSGWNIPLQQLAERAGRGPDLGAGPIRLACRSQCPVSWHQMHLWDPSLVAGNNDLALLRDTVKLNSLGIVLQQEQASRIAPERLQVACEDQWRSEDPSRELARDYKQKAAQLIRLQRERLAGLCQEHQAEVARLAARAELQVSDLQGQVQALQQALRQQQVLNRRLNEQTRHRDAQVSRRGALQVLERLAGQDVAFVVFHPGAGHITVPLQDVDRYLAGPLAYAASKCFVSEALYRQWLEHYQRPRCEGLRADGQRCDAAVARLETPGRFVVGDSDCCMAHKVARLRTVG